MIGISDTSVFVGHWPFQPLKHQTLPELKDLLSKNGISQAWVTSAEAVLYPDPMQGNSPLLEDATADPFFITVAVINPTLAMWRSDAELCLQRGCRAFKLVPNYHSYRLNSETTAGVLKLAEEANVPVCIQLRMSDERSHHPLMRVPGVSVEDVAALAQTFPQVRFLACGAYHTELSLLAGISNIWAETSFVESDDTLPKALRVMGEQHLVFGSHTPFFYLTAGLAKIAQAPCGTDLGHLRWRNAQVLLSNLERVS